MSYTYVTAFTGNIVSFVTATTITWTSPVISQLEDPETTPFDEALTSDESSWVSALLPLGAVFGPVIFGYLADKIGRKNILLLSAIPYLISFLVLAFAKTVVLYYLVRFLSGISVGGIFTVMPMYTGEIAEDSNRGALGSIMNCFICGGLLFSYSLGPYVSLTVFNVVLAIFPGIFLVVFFFLAPESPHYYVGKNKHDLASSALKKLRGDRGDALEKELTEVQNRIKEEGHGTFMDIFKSRGLIKALVISVGLLTFQQFSGINAVLFFSQSIFKEAGTSLEPAICSILVGVVQLLASLSTPLVVDRLGRKILLVFSAAGMTVSETVLGVYGCLKDNDYDVSSIAFLPILCVIMYVITYNVAFGSLPWAIMGELFPSNVKSAASSFSATVCWFLGFLITKYFHTISDAIGMGPSFLIFAGCCSGAIVFCLFYVIETKGKSLQEIQDILNS